VRNRPFHSYILEDNHISTRGPGSSVGIATDYGLEGPGSNPGGGRDFPHLFRPTEAHPASCTMGTGSFPGVKSGRGVTLTPHPLLVPWSRKSRAIPLLPLWAVRHLQSPSACTRVHFTLLKFTFQFNVSPQHMHSIQYCYPFHALEASSHLKANTLHVSYKHQPITALC